MDVDHVVTILPGQLLLYCRLKATEATETNSSQTIEPTGDRAAKTSASHSVTVFITTGAVSCVLTGKKVTAIELLRNFHIKC